MDSKQIYQLPDTAYNGGLRVPVQPTGGGAVSSLTLDNLHQAIGGIVIPKLEIRLIKEIGTDDKLKLSWAGPTGFWQTLNPEIWIYKYRGVKRFKLSRRWVHPNTGNSHVKHAHSKYYCGKSFLLNGDGTVNPITTRILPRDTEFECPSTPNTWATIDFEPKKYFVLGGDYLGTGGASSYPIPFPGLGDPSRIFPTGRRGSRAKTKRYFQHFRFRIVCDDPYNTTDDRKLLGPLSDTINAKPQIQKNVAGDLEYTRIVLTLHD